VWQLFCFNRFGWAWRNGFKEELTLVDGSRGPAIGLREDLGSAEAYPSATFPRALEKLGPMIEGTPRVENDQIGMTTIDA